MLAKHSLLPLVVGSIGLACSEPVAPVSHYSRGVHASGFEVNAFSPCGTGSQYYVTFRDAATGSAYAAARSAVINDNPYHDDRVFVEWYVTLSRHRSVAPDRYRILTVDSVVAVRPWSADVCSQLAASLQR